MSKEPTWKVGKQGLDLGKANMKAGCKHRSKSARPLTACGGCHARLYLALQLIAEGAENPQELAKRVFEVMKAEGRQP